MPKIAVHHKNINYIIIFIMSLRRLHDKKNALRMCFLLDILEDRITRVKYQYLI